MQSNSFPATNEILLVTCSSLFKYENVSSMFCSYLWLLWVFSRIFSYLHRGSTHSGFLQVPSLSVAFRPRGNTEKERLRENKQKPIPPSSQCPGTGFVAWYESKPAAEKTNVKNELLVWLVCNAPSTILKGRRGIPTRIYPYSFIYINRRLPVLNFNIHESYY